RDAQPQDERLPACFVPGFRPTNERLLASGPAPATTPTAGVGTERPIPGRLRRVTGAAPAPESRTPLQRHLPPTADALPANNRRSTCARHRPVQPAQDPVTGDPWLPPAHSIHTAIRPGAHKSSREQGAEYGSRPVAPALPSAPCAS